jgi:hypothetical protein
MTYRHPPKLNPAAGADLRDRFVERRSAKVKVSDLHVITMMEFLERARFESHQKILIVHASNRPETTTLLVALLISPSPTAK